MRVGLVPLLALTASLLTGTPATAQETPPDRASVIEQAQREKLAATHPYQPGTAEKVLNRVEDIVAERPLRVHPFFESAYAGGGFTLGAGYLTHLSAYNFVDVRGSITFSGYKRIEALFVAPRVFKRRGTLSLLGGWREATSVGFYGIGTANTSKDDRVNYSFDQPYGSATLDFRPTRQHFLLRGGVELSTWNVGSGNGPAPPIDEIYTPETLPGVGASPTYLHSEATAALDFRTSPGYARRGGYYGASFHHFHDEDGEFSFQRIDYEAIQHFPILRETWVLSLHARVQMANAAEGQEIPFFMLPSLGGGSSLRGFASWRFRDRNSLLLQAEWRVIASRFVDLALFYDAGRVAARGADLTDGPLKSDYGVGVRLHGPLATPLRIELGKSNEMLQIVFAASAAF